MSLDIESEFAIALIQIRSLTNIAKMYLPTSKTDDEDWKTFYVQIQTIENIAQIILRKSRDFRPSLAKIAKEVTLWR